MVDDVKRYTEKERIPIANNAVAYKFPLLMEKRSQVTWRMMCDV